MINFTLYKQGLKSNYKIFIIFLAILTLYTTVMISMYSGEKATALEEIYSTMPELMNTIGMTGDTTTLIGFIITYLYGFIYMLFPMIFTSMVANKLISSHTDKGSMAYLLSSPNSRSKIIFTQMKVIGTFIFALITYITIIGIIMSEIVASGNLDIGRFIILNIGLLVLHLAISGICFLASTIFNETKNAILFGAGIPVVFFLMQMLANMGGKLENLKYATIYTLFNPRDISKGIQSSYLMIGVLAIIAIGLYLVSFRIFKKKDLSV